MSSNRAIANHTQHAFLVAWGRFAQEIGLIAALENVPLHQKTHKHLPQKKVLEFFIAQLAGLEHLQDISLAAHPLDKDEAVAQAWGQQDWADYSGVSRSLSGLNWEEAEAITQAIEAVSRPILAEEVRRLRAEGRKLWYDGDLTGLPVSDNSRTFPNAARGHMANDIRLGYQAAVVSLQGITCPRIWLSVSHHPGDTVSCTQVMAMVTAAEARTGLYPRRRTGLLEQRLAAMAENLAKTQARFEKQQAALDGIETKITTLHERITQGQELVHALESQYQAKQRPERPKSKLTTARARLVASRCQLARQEGLLPGAQQRLASTIERLQQQQEELTDLQQHLRQLQRDNSRNHDPIEAVFRLDAGFASYQNIAWLIEMGYEVYTKPYSHRVVKYLQANLLATTDWIRVGKNAEMLAQANYQLKGSPYPLDIALARFETSKGTLHSAFLYFGSEPVTQDLPAWFNTYNSRQTIEAGIKESKQVFHLHRIKVRNEPAIYLQEQFVVLAANFIRWATQWLTKAQGRDENALDVAELNVKRQVQVAAHTSADVIWDSKGWLLKFSEHSAFAGRVLKLPSGEHRSPRDTPKKNRFFQRFSWFR